MKKIAIIGLMLVVISGVKAQEKSYAQALALTAMKMWPDSFSMRAGQPARWSYDQGVILKGVEGIWKATGDGKWFAYIQRSMDHYVREDGSIKGYRPDEFNIDHINNGKLLLTLYRVTGKEKYRKAVDLLRSQIAKHPRTSEGGFWHKKVYPYQMWLDGLYMGQPFYAEYASLFEEQNAFTPSSFDDITRQFVLMEKHSRDPRTGLLYHGWDESRKQRWADSVTGRSPHVWGRALGWFGMAMVDVLDYFPENHKGRDSIIRILQRFADGVTRVQDSKTGLWYDIPNMPNEPKNYVEASASSMLVYALAKGVRKGYLPAKFRQHAAKGYDGIVKQFIREEEGQTNLHGTVAVSGLGGNPYRDGSFAYYMSEPVIVNDPKGMGAFILAANEMELLPSTGIGKGKTVVLDNWYNNEWKKDPSGSSVSYHYTWNDRANSGFSILGDVFQFHGFQTRHLSNAPSAKELKSASVYLIVDPDTEKETEKPRFMTPSDAKVIADWVKRGGVLVLMANDAGNAELKNFNTLSSLFGIRFNEDNFNLVEGSKFEQGAVITAPGQAVFKPGRKLYIKELATLQVKSPATVVAAKEGRNVIAVSKHGKGAVFAIGDPWLYNEYVDGRKLPADFQNYEAAQDLVKWIATQLNGKK